MPDAEPRIEPIRAGGANKPYQVLGRDYVPVVADTPIVERGLASWYGRKFHGRRTASGEVYDMYAMTAAHPTLPIPSYARIRNPANGQVVIVRINDRGPFHAGRIVDLSYVAALKLDLLRGVAPVELERITIDEIRAGSWRRDGDAATRLRRRLRQPLRAACADRVGRDATACRSRRATSRSCRRRLRRRRRSSRHSRRGRRARPRAASGSSSAPFASVTAPRASSVASAATATPAGSRRCSRPSPTRAVLSRPGRPVPEPRRRRGAATRVRSTLGIVPTIVERR